MSTIRTDPLAAKVPSAASAGLAAIALCAGLWASPAVASPARPGPDPRPAPALVGTKAMPGLKNCGLGPAVVKPAGVILSCADANSLGKDLAWSKWGPTGAAARGVFTWNVCKPDCAASRTWDKSTANYALGDVVHTTKYGGLFEALTVHITGKKTGGFPRTMVYPQKPVG